MKSTNTPIPKELFADFNEALIATNGRLWEKREDANNPEVYRVDYSYNNTNDLCRFNERWRNINSKPVQEVKRNQKWRVLLRRFKLLKK